MELNRMPLTLLPISEERVFMRCDFNVSQDKKTRAITNPALIVAAVQSIQYCLDNGAKSVINCSHLSRPDCNKNAILG